jgi:hypothetical protein
MIPRLRKISDDMDIQCEHGDHCFNVTLVTTVQGRTVTINWTVKGRTVGIIAGAFINIAGVAVKGHTVGIIAGAFINIAGVAVGSECGLRADAAGACGGRRRSRRDGCWGHIRHH